MQMVTVLGATGSIGVSTLDVLSSHRERYQVYALTANRNVGLLAKQCQVFEPRFAVVKDAGLADELRGLLAPSACPTEVLFGVDALVTVASASDVDIVMAAIVGAAGLKPTLAAVNAGKKVLLANKEALVMSGALFMEAVDRSSASLLPVDSEHNAIFQCLPSGFGQRSTDCLVSAGVRKILLTGSGGPFRVMPLDQFDDVTPDQACAHPNWSMGRKISVDSATMMNKGLEFIEACWLFRACPDDIEVIVHPQSIVHSMVQYRDGSVLAQMGNPDMRTPIAHCLAWPERIESNVASLDFKQMSELTFEGPDFKRFPCLALAIEAMRAGGAYPAVVNAANEVAVDLFLSGDIKFSDIPRVIQSVTESSGWAEPLSIDDVIESDSRARHLAHEFCGTLNKG